uniref:Fibrinogen C-terminal domain-containing protein n=1 Tax=Ciona intestinalis TaxID=7719 RepID=H2Y1F5_CIOIN
CALWWYCIILVLLEANETVTHTNALNFTMYYEQLRTTTTAQIILNIQNLRQQRRTKCIIATPQDKLDKKGSATSDYTDCSEIYKATFEKSDVYLIWIVQLYRLQVCTLKLRVTRWIAIQKRISEHNNFNRRWKNYVDGFGNVREEYWIGLKNIRALTNQNTTNVWFGNSVTPPRMRIGFQDQDRVVAFAEYERFRVAGADDTYYLLAKHLDKATAIPANRPSPISAYWFSTYDNTGTSGWWFFACGDSNLNGLYPQRSDNSPSNIDWYYWYKVNKNNTARKSV